MGSSPSAKGWSHKSIKDTVKLPKNLISGKKRKFFKNPKKFPGPKQKYFQTPTDKISSEQLTKLQKIKPFGHSKAPKKKKKKKKTFGPKKNKKKKKKKKKKK